MSTTCPTKFTDFCEGADSCIVTRKGQKREKGGVGFFRPGVWWRSCGLSTLHVCYGVETNRARCCWNEPGFRFRFSLFLVNKGDIWSENNLEKITRQTKECIKNIWDEHESCEGCGKVHKSHRRPTSMVFSPRLFFHSVVWGVEKDDDGRMGPEDSG